MSKVSRRIFDTSISFLGRTASCNLYSFESDKYGNESYRFIRSRTVEAVISYPVEVPLDSYREHETNYLSDGSEIPSTAYNETDTHIDFFDVIPIDVFLKWEDDPKTGDFLVHFLYDEKDEKIPMVLRLSDAVAAVTTHLIWRKFSATPYRGSLPEEIQNEIAFTLGET
jgi:hypothetical protein